MEEILRNLSQNIDNNTGDNAYKPSEPKAEEESKAPEHEGMPESEPKDKAEEHSEPREEHHEDGNPWEDSAEAPRSEDHEPEAPEEAPEASAESEENAPEPEKEAPKAAILTMTEEESGEPIDIPDSEEPAEPEAEEPEDKTPEPEAEAPESESSEPAEPEATEEDSNRSQKYSPEVEAALSRLNAEVPEIAQDSEPLSTEPRKESHAGRFFLIFLFILAIAAVALCYLVETGKMDNPFPDIKKSEDSSSVPADVKTPDYETVLTDSTLISAIDTNFAQLIDTTNYYIYKRTKQTIGSEELVFYYVSRHEKCETHESKACPAEETITAQNFDSYSHYRYSFVKNSSGIYEFDEVENLDNTEE